MNPALLAAINKGGGKPPTKISKKNKIKSKRPPLRADQKQIEKPPPNAGRVVGKNYKPKPGGSGPPKPSQLRSSPQNNALLGNILAARDNMKKRWQQIQTKDKAISKT